MKKDPYQILDVPRTADADEIRRAYHRLARRYHPDQNPDTIDEPHRFHEVVTAYQLLSDPVQRARYDRHGGPIPDNALPSDWKEDLADAVRDTVSGLWGGLVNKGHAVRGKDITYRLDLDLSDAVLGCERTITFEGPEVCDRCGGMGGRLDQPGDVVQCKRCDGSGRIPVGPALLGLTKVCPDCDGKGRVVRRPCDACHGTGLVSRLREFAITVPSGTQDGATKVVPGKGAPGTHGGPPGDLQITISVRPHPILRVQGRDMVCTIPVSFVTLALGGDLDVPTVDGLVTMQVPAGTQQGNVFRIQGRGVPGRNGGRGDQLVTLEADVPNDLTPRQIELLESFQRLTSQDQVPNAARYQAFLDGQGSGRQSS
ncbi:MAG: J domain-containing protein [Deltaproteobacteria bacterium]|nr:J domain-containing protein [Deltaproteobacteria bacterium]